MGKLKKNEGVISIFLALLSLLSFVAAGLTIDLSRIFVAKANVEAAMELAGNAALSHYHSELFQKYGLFALADIDKAAEDGRKSLTQTLQGRDFGSYSVSHLLAQRAGLDAMQLEGDNLVDVQATRFSATTNPYAVLGNADVLEAQIVEFMKLYAPAGALDGFTAKWKSFFGASAVAESITYKMQFERELETTQDYIVRADGALQKLTIDETGTVGTPITDGVAQMQTALMESLQNLMGETDETVAREKFAEAQQRYRDVYDILQANVANTKIVSDETTALGTRTTAMGDARDAWSVSIENLPAGEIAQSMAGDYNVSAYVLPEMEIAALSADMQELHALNEAQVIAWSKVNVLEEQLTALQYDAWKAAVQEKYGVDAGGSSEEDGAESEGNSIGEESSENAGNSIGEESSANDAGQESLQEISKIDLASWITGLDAPSLQQTMQLGDAANAGKEALAQLSGGDRAGFFETIAALIERGALINRAKETGDPTQQIVTGTIGDRGISDEAMQRYEALQVRPSPNLDAPTWLGFGWLGSNAAIADTASKNISEAAGLLQGIEGLGESWRDHLFVLEYWDRMFSSQVTASKAENAAEARYRLTDTPFDDSDLYGAEREYILFGREQLQANQTAAKSSVFGIRFLMNGIYAFTSATLRQQTRGIALAVAGWTGFGVPLVQSALLLIAAAGESWLDIRDLMTGESVPVFKSESSWRFGINGLKEVAEDVVENVFETAENLIDGSVDALAEKAKGMSEQMVDSLQRAVRDSLRGPIDTMITRILSTPQIEGIDAVRAEVVSGLERLIQMTTKEGGSESRTIRLQALSNLLENAESVTGEITSLIEARDAAGMETSQVLSQAQQVVDNWVATTNEFIESAIDGVSAELYQRVDGALAGAQTAVSQKLEEAIDQFRVRLFGTGTSTGGITTGAGLVMDYDEYLKLLMALRMLDADAKDKMLMRTAIVIHANTDGIDLSEAATMLSLQAEAHVKLSFAGSDFVVDERTSLTDLNSIRGLWMPLSIERVFAY